jgi:hypothetical protein
MTEPFINPTTTGHQNFSDESLAEEGIGPDVMQDLKDIGLIVLAQPRDTKDEYVEAGLTVIMVNDERHSECPDEPHTHDHSPLAAGRITYSKAINLAVALMTMCIPMVPLSATEQGIVERINKVIDRHRAEAEAVAHTESRGGQPYNVI